MTWKRWSNTNKMDFRIWIWTHCLIIGVTKSLLLSHLPTPSFIIDVDVLQQRTKSTTLPRLFLPKYNIFVEPATIRIGNDPVSDDFLESTVYKADFELPGRALGYLHAKVIQIKNDNENVTNSTYIAEIDLQPSMCRDIEHDSKTGITNECWARLVQGLTNDRVGTYYWARSTGLGCSMMAIGVQYGDIHCDTGLLRWEDESNDGQFFSFKCNSNDGKRSEWVKSLQLDDTVQLVPTYGEEAIMNFLSKNRVYGVQQRGRPLGSEPKVVCEWQMTQSKSNLLC